MTLTHRRALILIGVVALIVRIAVIFATLNFHTIDDSHSYDRMAVSIAEHGTLPSSQIPFAGGPTAYPPPGFPVALSLAYLISGTSSEHARWDAGRVEEALFGTIAVLLIALIATRVFGRRTGVVAGAIAAVYPPLLLAGSSLMSESLFIPLMLGAVLAALHGRDSPHRYRYAALSGLLIALAAMTRSNGIVVLIPLCFLLWTEHPRWSLRAVRTPAIAVAATAVALTPWAVRNTVEFHQFVPISTETGYALAGTYNAQAQYNAQYPALWTPPAGEIYSYLKSHPKANEAQIGDDLTTFARHYVGAHPAYPLAVIYWSALRLFNLTGPGYERASAPFAGYSPTFAYWSVIAFYVLALITLSAVALARPRGAPWALWGCPLAIILSTLLFAGLTRYRAPADPFLIILAAAAVPAAAGRIRRKPPTIGDPAGRIASAAG